MTKNLLTPAIKNLSESLASLKKANEVVAFLRDVATTRELNEMAKRWQAAQLLDQGITYRVVSRKTGLSTTTVARVAAWLRDGTGGYRAALNKLKK